MHNHNISLPSPTGRGKAAVGGAGEGLSLGEGLAIGDGILGEGHSLLVKVCGMRSPDNIRAVAQLPIDMMGFIFYPRSSRYVGMLPSHTGLLPDRADEALGEALAKGRHIYKVGVFVDAMPQDIITHVVSFGLDAVQLHGTETPILLRNLRLTIVPDLRPRLTIMKAVSIASAVDFEQCEQYEGVADMFVFDTKCCGHGGSGEQFDWSLLNAYKGHTPFLLSGGIGEGDVERIRAIRHPMFAGVDLNSRFEMAPAVKDAEALGRFIGQLQ